MIPPEDYIEQIRKIYPGHYHEKCHRLYKSLKNIYPDAEGFYDGDHVITKINGKYLDISGEVTDTSRYLPLEEYGEDHLRSSFNEKVLVTDDTTGPE